MRLHNTLSGRVEEFTPRDNRVLMYVCGITPYAESHLGHAHYTYLLQKCLFACAVPVDDWQ